MNPSFSLLWIDSAALDTRYFLASDICIMFDMLLIV